MRKHIAKALQARSQAIRTAIDRYNTAAAALTPPRAALEWSEVIEYGFLAEFDLLRDTRQDIRVKPWATPAGRFTMDLHFKMLRAAEEIDRLNIKICRFVTFIQNENHFLCKKEEEVRASNVGLAHQIYLYHMEHGRFIGVHLCQLQKVSKLVGFTGTLAPGVSMTHRPSGPAPEISSLPALPSSEYEEALADDDEEIDESAMTELHEAFYDVLSISTD
jgi:hypothetical protein